jgi:hypothetical protein
MMNRLEIEKKQPPPFESRPIQGVAAIIVARSTNLIYTVVETTSRPEYGKEAGMRTIPMETIESGQKVEDALGQLFEQEVHENLNKIRVEFIRYYGIGNMVAARLYLVHVEKNGFLHNGNGYNRNVRAHEVTDPKWMAPEDLLRQRVRMGVPEMIEDYLLGVRGGERECKSLPQVYPSNRTKPG